MEKSSNLSLDLPRVQLTTGQVRNTGLWSSNEHMLYIIFLNKYKKVIISKKKSRNNHIYDLMSQFIGSRDPLQCRSHHNKALEKTGQTHVIISKFKKIVGKKQFMLQYQRYSDGKTKPNLFTVVRDQQKDVEASPVVQNQQIKVEEQERTVDKTTRVYEERREVYYPFSGYFDNITSQSFSFALNYPIFGMGCFS